jgi:hypothetical protein
MTLLPTDQPAELDRVAGKTRNEHTAADHTDHAAANDGQYDDRTSQPDNTSASEVFAQALHQQVQRFDQPGELSEERRGNGDNEYANAGNTGQDGQDNRRAIELQSLLRV